MHNPAFIVEGEMEQKFLTQICGRRGIRVLTVGVNGKNVPMKAMSKHIGALLRQLNDRNYPVVIVFDRETRKETCDELLNDLCEELEELRKLGHHRYDPSKLMIGISDRMTENWILADHEYMTSVFGVKFEEKKSKYNNFEGRHGKNIIKELLADISYKETSRGVEMLRGMDFRRASLESPSLKKFLESLDIDCRMLNLNP